MAGLENDTLVLDNALGKLQQLSLITEHWTDEDQRYSILPITREYALAELATLSKEGTRF